MAKARVTRRAGLVVTHQALLRELSLIEELAWKHGLHTGRICRGTAVLVKVIDREDPSGNGPAFATVFGLVSWLNNHALILDI